MFHSRTTNDYKRVFAFEAGVPGENPPPYYAAPTMLRINSTTFVSRFDSWNAEIYFTPKGSSPTTSGGRFFQPKTLVFFLYFRHRNPYDARVKLNLGHSIALPVVFIIGEVLSPTVYLLELCSNGKYDFHMFRQTSI